jgi:hypothetical protein
MTEVIARFVKEQFRSPLMNPRFPPESLRCVDVLLFYGSTKGWCRCQPTASPRPENTWIQVAILSRSTFVNYVYKFMDVSIHTLLPWGRVGWKINMMLVTVSLVIEGFLNFRGVFVSALIAIALKAAMYGGGYFTRGDGANWVSTWYLGLFQMLTYNTPLQKTFALIWGNVTSIVN